MIIEFQGKTYDLDLQAVTVGEFRQMKAKYKLTAVGFEKGIADGDPDALTCLYWVMERQAGNTALVLSDALDFPVGPLYSALAASGDEKDAEPEPDPTQGSPSPPASPSPPEPPA